VAEGDGHDFGFAKEEAVSKSVLLLISKEGSALPAIGKVGAHILQIGIAHIIYGENKQIVILLQALPDIGKKPSRLLLVRLFDGFGFVNNPGAL
jgi:hypothetical protein